ncbi:adenine phosphoribosyltransferase [Bombus vosnesenskii]|uniref:Adenine phosphoribosyltransferase n=4 Tax=Bombus TaxID=28641 RepID=A0A6J3LKL6_9HYME|nr:adenine phosphoribosyltransferase [Bombus terrestris]XP_003485104.1 adenine phosphoribosyltransferase [Bombus impatiens]XP_033187486.1 adenine phosphoribosyltransferase [Bombus vancouverensis nearcticus]XP_033304896.1 adenine phosphoribosyltransferase [Bombus bifarius]XP_033366063.1 adenine phosphoribosyltransferase [Bombus vosnesenskii]XP_050489447.1 adenine phosphoribosyltransferase [Bombus huntii]XP_050592518.1 adenine phosphoribosyltransferase [Bombus affinis]
MNKDEKIQLLRDAIDIYPNFPKPGIIYRDIFGVFRNIVALRAMKDLIVEHILFLEVDLVVGLDSRGFLFGPIICMELGKPFLPVRKKGKLPGNVVQHTFTLEYGQDTFEIQTKHIKKGTRVLIVDDLLATGGSMLAAISLIKSTGAEVIECLTIIELTGLKGREKLGVPVHSFVQYD